ncbi:MAG: HAD family hydrolase [Clostridia bacterium]|nr:HAD family hydrolase [Clostridia bacterium]
MKKLCIFDMDGTLLDSAQYLADNINLTFSSFNLAPVTVSECIEHFEERTSEMFLSFLSSRGIHDMVLLDKLLRSYRQHAGEGNYDLVYTYAGMRDLLFRLEAQGVEVAVLTPRDEAFAKPLLYRLCPGIPYLFSYLDEEKRKPAPDALLRILSYFDVHREDVLYIGDSEWDIGMGNNARVKTLSAAWGYRSREYLLEHGAEDIISLPDEILSFLY